MRSFVLLLLLTVLALRAAPPTPVAEWLARDLLDDALLLRQVRAFTEPRIPRVTPPKNLEQWELDAARLRREILDQVVFRGEAAQWRQAPLQVHWLDTISGGPGYVIRKLRYEALPGWWIPAVLYQPEQLSGRVPAVLNVNGHESLGKAIPYKQARCINLARRGYLTLNPEWIGMGQLSGPAYSHYKMNQLDLCGTSGLAPFYLAMSRALDVLCQLEHADTNRIAVAGLSGGGWQTIVLSSLDTRVALANPVAGYSSFRTRLHHREDLGDSEQTPCDLATLADYTHLTALLAPRPALLTYNIADNCCFASAHALPPLLQAAAPIYDLYHQPHHLRAHVNLVPGTHNFDADNRQAFYRFLADCFEETRNKWSASDTTDWPVDDQLKSAKELQVELPPDNLHFNAIARRLSNDLPRDAERPAAGPDRDRWMQDKREHLVRLLRLPNYKISAKRLQRNQINSLTLRSWMLNAGDDWSIPAVEFLPAKASASVVVLADGGRTNLLRTIEKLLEEGARVLAIDPFLVGESRIVEGNRETLYALTVAAVGERPLGIQTAQLDAVVRWYKRRNRSGPLRLLADGPRTTTMALAAACLEDSRIGQLELRNNLNSFKEIIEDSWPVTRAPELFCFGLLEHLDIDQLKLLAGPRLN